MTKFRTSAYDAPEPRKAKQTTPGTMPDNKIGVYDGKGRLRGRVGPGATSATASRFHGQLGSRLGTGPDGKPAWLAPTLADVSAQGSAMPGAQGDTLADVSSKGVTATQIKSGGQS
jgi:hypothetical protein